MSRSVKRDPKARATFWKREQRRTDRKAVRRRRIEGDYVRQAHEQLTQRPAKPASEVMR